MTKDYSNYSHDELIDEFNSFFDTIDDETKEYIMKDLPVYGTIKEYEQVFATVQNMEGDDLGDINLVDLVKEIKKRKETDKNFAELVEGLR